MKVSYKITQRTKCIPHGYAYDVSVRVSERCTLCNSLGFTEDFVPCGCTSLSKNVEVFEFKDLFPSRYGGTETEDLQTTLAEELSDKIGEFPEMLKWENTTNWNEVSISVVSNQW